MENFKILKDLIKFNTIKDKENKEIIDYIEKILLEKGLKTEYKGKYLIMSTDKEAISFHGVKAHSSNPAKGKSANMNAIKFIYELDKFYNEKIKKDLDENYEVPYTTMNVGLMNGGSAKNSVPANCEISIDFRIMKSEHIELIKEKLNELSSKYDCKVNIIEEIQPFCNEVEFVDKIKTANFLTEASAVKNSKRIILGAGPVTAHEVNEHITVESYKKLVEQYKNIIKKVCT